VAASGQECLDVRCIPGVRRSVQDAAEIASGSIGVARPGATTQVFDPLGILPASCTLSFIIRPE
jgi:hypothetical protein